MLEARDNNVEASGGEGGKGDERKRKGGNES